MKSVSKLTQSINFIEQTENENNKILRVRQQTEHKINSLELELRNQSDFIQSIQNENMNLIKQYDEFIILQDRVKILQQEKEELLSEQENRSQKFFEDKSRLETKNNKLKLELVHLEDKHKELKRDMEMVSKINKMQVEESIYKEKERESKKELEHQIDDLRTSLKMNSSNIQKEKKKVHDLELLIEDFRLRESLAKEEKQLLQKEIQLLGEKLATVEEDVRHEFVANKTDDFRAFDLSKHEFKMDKSQISFPLSEDELEEKKLSASINIEPEIETDVEFTLKEMPKFQGILKAKILVDEIESEERSTSAFVKKWEDGYVEFRDKDETIQECQKISDMPKEVDSYEENEEDLNKGKERNLKTSNISAFINTSNESSDSDPEDAITFNSFNDEQSKSEGEEEDYRSSLMSENFSQLPLDRKTDTDPAQFSFRNHGRTTFDIFPQIEMDTFSRRSSIRNSCLGCIVSLIFS
jgi:exonuclease SbcC